MIIREPVPVGVVFKAPFSNVTFGWQEKRREFSVWYEQGPALTTEYIVVPTGADFVDMIGYSLQATIVLPDGYHAYHLLKGKTTIG